MPVKFDWRGMGTAPRDGTQFVCLTTCIMASENPMPFRFSAHAFVLGRAWIGERVGDGYWLTDLGNSQGDRQVAGGHWMPIEEFCRWLIVLLYMGREWRSAPQDRPVVLLRSKSREGWKPERSWLDIGIDFAWRDASQEHPWRTSKTFGGWMAPGYMDGVNVAMGGYSWCELDEFLPPDVIEKELASRERHDAFLASRTAG